MASKRNIVIGGCAVVAVGAVFVGGTLGFAGAGALGWWAYHNYAQGGGVEALAGMVDDDAEVFVAIQAGSGAMDTIDAILDEPTRKQLAQGSTDLIGLDLTTASGWLQTGLDVTKPVGVAVDSNKTLTMVLPLRDNEAATQALTTAFTKNGGLREEKTIAGSPAWITNDAGFAIVNDYLIVRAPNVGDPEQSLVAYLGRDDTTVAETAGFDDLSDTAGSGWNVFGYVSAEAVRKQGGHELANWGEGTPAGFTMTFTDEAISTRIFANGANDPMIQALASVKGKDQLSGKLPGDAIGAVRISIDPQKAWEVAKNDADIAGDLADASAQTKRDLGLDLKTDIVDHLSGDVTIVLLESGGGGPSPVDFVAFAGIDDTVSGKSIVNSVDSQLPGNAEPDGEDALWLDMDSFGLAVAHEHLIITSGRGQLTTTRSGLKSGLDGYWTQFPDETRKAMENGPHLAGYVDVQELATSMLGASAALLLGDASSLVSGVSVVADLEGEVYSVELVTHAPEGGYTAALHELLDGTDDRSLASVGERIKSYGEIDVATGALDAWATREGARPALPDRPAKTASGKTAPPPAARPPRRPPAHPRGGKKRPRVR